VVPSAVGPPALAISHPSAVLRAPDGLVRRKLLNDLIDDLRVAHAVASGRAA
jgi:hypothetical protein